MTVRIIENPAAHAGWAELVRLHPHASVFHLPGWLDALQQTYGFEPFVVTTSPGAMLENGLVACRVKNWTGHRLVSLPFSDHCEPLLGIGDSLSTLVEPLVEHARAEGWPSIELRPCVATNEGQRTAAGLGCGSEFVHHTLDLRGSAQAIFERFHPSSTQRAIRKAEREGVTYESGVSDWFVGAFFKLFRLTRRRHGLPPQPLVWFRNLVACLGDRVAIHLALLCGRPVAAIMTVSLKTTMVYKYGGSDGSFHRLGVMPFLFWKVIRQAMGQGCERLDLGRSDLDQPGLIAFKEHLGATSSKLTYLRWPESQRRASRAGWVAQAARRVVAYLPDDALDLAGRVLYRHFA
ncbi:MAG: lipid II:glycine glycyltransferase FemX [Vicinamibacterales bacterium]